jgi:superfamily II DNA or RNA helicase
MQRPISTSGFAGRGPGQQLALVLERFTFRDLTDIIGPELLALVGEEVATSKPDLVKACRRILLDEPDRLNDASLTRSLLRNFDPGKREELAARMAASNLPANNYSGAKAQDVVRRFLGLGGEPEEPTVPRPAIGTVEASYGLFPHQRSVVRRIHAAIGRGEGRAVVHMPTGAGKTRTAMHYAARLLNDAEPCAIVWLTSGRELLEQAVDAFQSAWGALGNRGVAAHRFWGDHDADPSTLEDGILIAGFAKMQAWIGRDPVAAMRLAARTHVVIVDEAHQAIAPTYREVIEAMAEAGQRNAVLGLTATPGRTWSDIAEDEALAAFFGNRKVVLEIKGYDNPVEYLLTEGYLAQPSFTQLRYAPSASATGRVLPSPCTADYDEDMRSGLAGTAERNRAILDGVEGLLRRGHERIILFAASVAHARLLSTALELRGTSTRVVTGETPASQRSAILSEFKRPSRAPMVLCNFGVLTTGFDAPRTSAAVIARPTRSLVLFSQMVGRATRGPRAGGNEHSEILTVHDPSCPGFGDVAEAFFNWEDIWNE